MSQVLIQCSYCHNFYYKEKKYVNQNKKGNNKNYCSINCFKLKRLKRILIKCENPSCRNIVSRTPAAISQHNFCSIRCFAVTINPSHPTMKICANPLCGIRFHGNRKYCSGSCVPIRVSKYSKEKIIEMIKLFVSTSNRIPTKRDLNIIYKVARYYFGTWNNAVYKAGFSPRTERFSKKYISNDGHMCDSLSEKIIDDWLFAHKISHLRNVPYPGDRGFRVDFLVGGFWIEFFGLSGHLQKYDELKRKKVRLAKKYNLKLVSLYPKDIFPKFVVDKKLEFLIN